MNESLEELASLYVLDRLSADERAAFEKRLLDDPELTRLTREFEHAMAGGIHSLPARKPPITALDKIEQRIDALSAAASPVRTPLRGFNWPSFARWGIAAMIAISLMTLAVQSVRHSSAQQVIMLVEMNAGKNTFAELPMREGATDSDARFIQLASLAENYWRKKRDLMVKPDSTANTEHRGYALFDPESQQGFIAIQQLPVLASNQRYHLWVVDAATGQSRDAGILPLAGLNRGLYSFALNVAASRKNERPNIFVTVEEDIASADPGQPRGKVVLGRSPI